jgi:uncharacterized protein VirK/YbjX
VTAFPDRKSTPVAAPGLDQRRPRLRAFIVRAIREHTPDEAIKVVVRALLFRRTTSGWLKTAHSLCRSAGASPPPLDLVEKVQTPLAHRRFNLAARSRLLRRHYEILASRLGLGAVGRLLRDERVVVARAIGRSGRAYLLDLRRDLHTRSEGELVICLSDAAAPYRALAKLTLIVGDFADGTPAILWIGGLQGPEVAPDAKTAIVAATRELWGLRPKQAVLEAAYALAEVLGVGAIKAVSRRAHAIRRRFAGREVIKADYDGFWREMSGVPDGEGAFDLPSARPRRAEAEVRPGKRSAWRARQALIASIVAAVGDLAQGQPDEEPALESAASA